MTKKEVSEWLSWREYLAKIGREGGKAKGKSKVRGDAEYYSRIGKKAAKARKAKRNAGNQSSGSK